MSLTRSQDRPRLEGVSRPLASILAIAAIALVAMPFFSSFGELLTKVAMAAGVDAWLGWGIAPVEAHLVHGVLAFFGIQSAAEGSILFVGRDTQSVALYISWNCVGWQTLVFFGVTLLTGLSRDYTLRSRIETVFFGFAGIAMLNIARITGVAIVALHFGRVPALLVHDYGSLLATVVFLIAFWAFAYNVVLEHVEPDGEAAA